MLTWLIIGTLIAVVLGVLAMVSYLAGRRHRRASNPGSLNPHMRRIHPLVIALVGLNALSCVEGGNLAISAGAPVAAVVQGRITDCGRPVASAEVVLQVQQDLPEQARPVDTEIGPLTTGREGRYLFEVGPSFAVPGPADMQLRITSGGIVQEIPGGILELRLGPPPSDTTRFDADLGAERGGC